LEERAISAEIASGTVSVVDALLEEGEFEPLVPRDTTKVLRPRVIRLCLISAGSQVDAVHHLFGSAVVDHMAGSFEGD
jgi:hypothetical protein